MPYHISSALLLWTKEGDGVYLLLCSNTPPAQGTGSQLSRESAPPGSLAWLDALSCSSELCLWDLEVRGGSWPSSLNHLWYLKEPTRKMEQVFTRTWSARTRRNGFKLAGRTVRLKMRMKFLPVRV